MAAPNNKVQRANKLEAFAAREVLKGLWEKAYRDGVLSIDYPEDDPIDSEEKAKVLYNALAEYRKKIRKKQTENYEIFLKISACSLLKSGKYSVELRRKPAKVSNRSSIILDLINTIPDLGIQEPKNEIENIMQNFKD